MQRRRRIMHVTEPTGVRTARATFTGMDMEKLKRQRTELVKATAWRKRHGLWDPTSVVIDIDVVLHTGVPRLDIKRPSPGLSVASSEAEQPTAAQDRQLPHRLEDAVPPENAQGAAVVLPGREGEVEDHQQRRLGLGGKGIDALGPAHGPRPQLWALSEGIVDHDRGPEPGGRPLGGLGHPDRGGVGAAHDVVEVEVEVAQLLAPETERLTGDALRESSALGFYRANARADRQDHEEDHELC